MAAFYKKTSRQTRGIFGSCNKKAYSKRRGRHYNTGSHLSEKYLTELAPNTSRANCGALLLPLTPG
jgi:hypothetical protein